VLNGQLAAADNRFTPYFDIMLSGIGKSLMPLLSADQPRPGAACLDNFPGGDVRRHTTEADPVQQVVISG
jgi:hypothetical protein